MAAKAEHGEKDEETDPILRKPHSQDNDHCGASRGADHSEPSFCGAKRRAAADTTIAAEVPAQKGLSGWSQKAT